MRIVQLLSGGFDSTGHAMLLQNQGHTIYPLYVHFRKGGGKQAKEEATMHIVSKDCGFEAPHLIQHLIPKSQYDTRNRIMCKVASKYALTVKADTIAIGSLHQEDLAEYDSVPDEDVLVEHLQLVVPQGITVITLAMLHKYKAPLLAALRKSQRSIMFKTVSCHMWYKVACGKCYACVERHAAFLIAMGYDRTIYMDDPKTAPIWRAFFKAELKAYNERGNVNETT